MYSLWCRWDLNNWCMIAIWVLITKYTASILMYLGSTRLCHEVAIQTKTFHKADFLSETSRRNTKLNHQIERPVDRSPWLYWTLACWMEYHWIWSNQWIYQLSTIQQLTSRESQCASCTRGPDRTPKPWSMFEWMFYCSQTCYLTSSNSQQPLALLWQCCMMDVLLVQQDYYCSKKVLGQTIRLLWPTSALPPARLSPDAELATNAATSQGTTLQADASFLILYLGCCNNSRSQKELQVLRIWTLDTLMMSQNALVRDIKKIHKHISSAGLTHVYLPATLTMKSFRSITMITSVQNHGSHQSLVSHSKVD